MKHGSITVVIPTHNRYAKLRELLGSIQRNSVKEIDSVIVVDDSENPIRIASQFPNLHVRQILLEERVFISRAKNIGWRNAATDFVLFIDDDNVVDENTIPRLYQAIWTRSDLGAVMPAVLYKSEPNLVWVYAPQFRGPGPKFNLIGRNLHRNSSLENSFLAADALPNSFIIRRKALQEVGGFDERLIVNSSMALSLKLKSKGWQVLAFTGSFIYHDVEPPGKMGWWATHGAVDPERVRFEIRDWFIIMRMTSGTKRFFVLHAVAESLRFIIPNTFAYVVRSNLRKKLVLSLAKGYLEGLRISFQSQDRTAIKSV